MTYPSQFLARGTSIDGPDFTLTGFESDFEASEIAHILNDTFPPERRRPNHRDTQQLVVDLVSRLRPQIRARRTAKDTPPKA